MCVLTSQNAHMTAQLEQVSTSEATLKREIRELRQELSKVNQQRQELVQTTEMYEAEKRELEHEVRTLVVP